MSWANIRPKIYTVGLDLGQANDPTAIAVVETEILKRVYRDGLNPEPRQVVEGVEHRVRHLERLPLGMAYPLQVAHVRGLMLAPELRPNDTELTVDETGVGRPVADLFEAEGMKPHRVMITAGFEETRVGSRSWRVPKVTLVSRLQAALHAKALRLSPQLREAQALRQELAEFRMRHTASGAATFGAREGRHDDLVLALAIAVWRAQARSRGPGIRQAPLLGV